jgi:hypothetical protein
MVKDKPNNKNYGVISDWRKEEEKAKDWIVGSTYIVPKTILVEDGNWEKWLPKFEMQWLEGFETMACVSYSFNNVLEILFRRLYGIEVNFSDRFLAKMSRTDVYNGNTFWNVFNTARDAGLVDEDKWTWKDLPKPITWQSYYATIPETIKNEALDFKNQWEIYWETIPNLNQQNFISMMKFWLRYSPLWACINNWQHAVTIYADAGDKAKVYDHYLNCKYDYDWDKVNFASILVLTKKNDTFIKEKESSAIYLAVNDVMGKVLLPIRNSATYWELADKLLNWKKEQGWTYKTLPKEKINQYRITKPISISL